MTIADGNEKAFERFYFRYVSLLEPYLMRMLRNEDEVEEVIQMTMMKVWLHREKLPEVTHPKAWTFRIAANLCFNSFRRKLLVEKSISILKEEKFAEQDASSDVIHFREMKRSIEETIQQLPAQRKRIYKMHREDGMKVKEIAEELGIAETTVKKTLQVALQQIRDELQKKGFMPVIAAIILKIF